jgi:hypothetical protein
VNRLIFVNVNHPYITNRKTCNFNDESSIKNIQSINFPKLCISTQKEINQNSHLIVPILVLKSIKTLLNLNQKNQSISITDGSYLTFWVNHVRPDDQCTLSIWSLSHETDDSPSNRPSPCNALLGWQYQLRSYIFNSPSFSVTSVGDIAIRTQCQLYSQNSLLKRYSPPGKSCLFANTRSRQSFISLSFKILWSSCLASSILSLSCESTTKTRACVPV